VQSFSGPSPAGLTTTFYCLRFETPPTRKPGRRVYIPQEQGGPVIPQALGSLFVASYDSQDYGGGTDPTENTVFHNYFTLSCYTAVNQQWLFLWLYNPGFQQMHHSIYSFEWQGDWDLLVY
jgi:hypothetical protein